METQKIRVEKIERIFLPNIIWRFCAECESEQIFVSAERATIILETTTRKIFHLVETAKIHFFESEEGLTLVCTKSMVTFGTRNLNTVIYEEISGN